MSTRCAAAGIAGAVLVAIMLAACSDEPTPAEPDADATATAPDETPAEGDELAPDGTPCVYVDGVCFSQAELDEHAKEGAVHRPGETFEYGDWEIVLGETDTDATQDVIDYQLKEYDGEEEFTTPPEDGNVFITVPVTITYTGAYSGEAYMDPTMDLSFAYVSADGNTYADIMAVEFPDDLSYVGELYAGGVGEGAILQEVPTDDAEGGRWRISWDSVDAAPDSEAYVAAN